MACLAYEIGLGRCLHHPQIRVPRAQLRHGRPHRGHHLERVGVAALHDGKRARRLSIEPRIALRSLGHTRNRAELLQFPRGRAEDGVGDDSGLI